MSNPTAIGAKSSQKLRPALLRTGFAARMKKENSCPSSIQGLHPDVIRMGRELGLSNESLRELASTLTSKLITALKGSEPDASREVVVFVPSPPESPQKPAPIPKSANPKFTKPKPTEPEGDQASDAPPTQLNMRAMLTRIPTAGLGGILGLAVQKRNNDANNNDAKRPFAEPKKKGRPLKRPRIENTETAEAPSAPEESASPKTSASASSQAPEPARGEDTVAEEPMSAEPTPVQTPEPCCDEKVRKRCDRRHEAKFIISPCEGTCDVCSKPVELGDQIGQCKECSPEWWICKSCFQPAQAFQGPEVEQTRTVSTDQASPMESKLVDDTKPTLITPTKGHAPKKLLAGEQDPKKRSAAELAALEKLVECTDETPVRYEPGAKNATNYAKSYQRYEAYSKATTLKEALELGSRGDDLVYDCQKGFLTVVGEPKRKTPVDSTSVVSKVDKFVLKWQGMLSLSR